jgi:hypothetical protein
MSVFGDERNLAGWTGYIRVARRSRLNRTRALDAAVRPSAFFAELLRLPCPSETLGAG